MDYLKQNHLSILIIVFLVISNMLGMAGTPKVSLGALDRTTVGNPWTFSGAVTNNSTVKIGTNGSTITELQATTCALIGTDASQAASSTVAYDCAVTGVASGDVVMAQLATSTPRAGVGHWNIVGSKASTTAGFVTVMLFNHGAAAVPSVTAVGSSTQIWYMDN